MNEKASCPDWWSSWQDFTVSSGVIRKETRQDFLWAQKRPLTVIKRESHFSDQTSLYLPLPTSDNPTCHTFKERKFWVIPCLFYQSLNLVLSTEKIDSCSEVWVRDSKGPTAHRAEHILHFQLFFLDLFREAGSGKCEWHSGLIRLVFKILGLKLSLVSFFFPPNFLCVSTLRL